MKSFAGVGALPVAVINLGCGGGGDSDGSAQSAQLSGTDAVEHALGVSPPKSIVNRKIGTVAFADAVVQVTAIRLITVKKVTTDISEYEYATSIAYNGPKAEGMVLTLTNVGPGTSVVDGTVSTGPVAAGSYDLPNDTVHIRHDRSFAFSTDAWVWKAKIAPTDYCEVSVYPQSGAPVILSLRPTGQQISTVYAPDALFFGTGSKTLVTKPADIRLYFERALLTNRPRGAALGEHAIVVISDTAVVVTGVDTATGTKDGKTYTANGRVTFVVEKRGEDWQIVHFHRSALPD